MKYDDDDDELYVNDLERGGCCLLVNNIEPFGLILKNISRN
jgi:hypothetical protein